MSILINKPELDKQISEIAEVAGYLWQKGWTERNGGNTTISLTSEIDNKIHNLPPISEVIPIGKTFPHLKGCYFYCKGTNLRMSDLARRLMENGSIIRILDDCNNYVIVADKPVKPTSEIASHLLIHNYLRGLGIAPYVVPDSFELADATIRELDKYDVVMWEKHGTYAVGENIMEAFDMVDTLSKSAQIYLIAKTMGFEPKGLTIEQMEEMKKVFNLPK